MSGSDSGAARSGTTLTPAQQTQGAALTAGTPTFLTQAVPADGKVHQFVVSVFIQVTTVETGGQIVVKYTCNGFIETVPVDAGGHAAGQYAGTLAFVCDAGSSVQVNQGTGLSAGAATITAAISGG